MSDIAIPAAALIISLATFIATQISSSRTAGKDYVKALEGRITRLESENARLQTELDRCSQVRDQLQGEVIALMRKLLNVDHVI